MTARFTVRSEVDLIALAPVLLGFTPSKSLVMVTFNSFHARVDLPTPADIDDCVAALLDPTKRHQVRQVAFLIYDGEDHPELQDVLVDQFTDHGVQVMAALQVGESSWKRFGDTSWTPLDVETHPQVLDAHYDGVAPKYGTRDDMQQYVRPCGAERTAEALEAVELIREVGVDGVIGTLTRETASDTLDKWIAALRSSTPGSTESQELAVIVGFTAWLKGDGAMAWIAIDQADQSASMTMLLKVALDKAVSPAMWSEFIA